MPDDVGTDEQPVQDKRAAASAAIAEAEAAWDNHEWLAAGRAYERVLALFPQELGDGLWYEAALAYRFARRWDKAYELGKEAAARAERGKGEPAFWNLGIAATIERDWTAARDAWRGYGLTIPDGDGEIDADFGPCCVRISDGVGGQETVWVRRLCPARARIVSVPYGDRRFGEIVVHDGAPNGSRIVDGHEFPVFDELMLFRASDTPSWRITVTGEESSDIAELQRLFADAGLGAEPTSTVRFICSCCDTSSLESGKAAPSGAVDIIAAAPDEATVRSLLTEWADQRPEGRVWHGIHTKI